jgi:hypothetical protein
MTGPDPLERGYRRLLAWYPRPFRREQEEEMLAVLLASTREGQRRPRLREAANVIYSAAGMRLRAVRSGPANQGWADALAMFSLAAPLFVVVMDLLEVALPYRPYPDSRFVFLDGAFGSHPAIGGLSLIGQGGLDVAAGGQVIIAVLVLLGLRRLALAAMAAAAVYWFTARYWIPEPLQLFSTGFYLLEAAALIVSPGPRHRRHLVNWGHGVVLLLVAAAVQVSTLRYDATSGPAVVFGPPPAKTTVYLVVSVVLAVAAVALAVVLKMNRYFLLLFLALLYPYAMELALSPGSSSSDLIGSPTPVHLVVLYLPGVLLAGAVMFIAVRPRLSRAGAPDVAG